MGKCVSKGSIIGLPKKRSLTKESEISGSSEGLNIGHNSIFSRSERKFIHDCLKKHYLFKQLTKPDMSSIIDKMKKVTFKSDSMVYEQDSNGSKFFIVQKGQLTIIRDQEVIGKLVKSDTFGEMALLTQTQRKETIRTSSDSILWTLGRNSFKLSLKQIFLKNFDSTREFISNVPFFSNAADSQKDLLTRVSVFHNYKEGENFVSEGELMFILLEGKVVKNNLEVNPGEYFGEVSVLTGNLEKTLIEVKENSRLLSLDSAALMNAFGENFRDNIFKNMARYSLAQDTYLDFLSKENIITLVESLTWNQYRAGEVVIAEGYDKKSKFCIVCTGELKSAKTNHIISHLQVIGLRNPNERSILTEDYIAGNDTIIGEVTASSIENMLSLSIDAIFQEASSIKFLRNISIFKYLSLSKLNLLSSKLYNEEFDKKEIIFSYKDPADRLFIIQEGKVEIFHEGKVFRTLGKFDFFGEKCLNDEKRTASARASTRVQCWILGAKDFRHLIDESITMELERRRYYQADILLSNIMYTQTVESKAHRKMYITYYPASNSYYSVQVIEKSDFTTSEQVLSLVQEKNINLQLDFHLIIKLVKTFTDESRVFFVTEHINSVNLREYMKTHLRESAVRFIVSCLSTCLEYLHDKEIVYRDLCPENILVNYLGIPHLFNFSASKIVKGRTYTNIGNPFYKSPEILTGRGYSKSVDYWSLGVLMYEMLYCQLPFGILHSDDPVSVYQKVISETLKFPPTQSYALANQLIEKLLVKDHNKAQPEDIKKSSWMKNVDWDRLQRPASLSFVGPKVPIARMKSLKEADMVTFERFIDEASGFNRMTGRRGSVVNNIRWDKFF
jgi:cGMP-dependent protein kinase